MLAWPPTARATTGQTAIFTASTMARPMERRGIAPAFALRGTAISIVQLLIPAMLP